MIDTIKNLNTKKINNIDSSKFNEMINLIETNLNNMKNTKAKQLMQERLNNVINKKMNDIKKNESSKFYEIKKNTIRKKGIADEKERFNEGIGKIKSIYREKKQLYDTSEKGRNKDLFFNAEPPEDEFFEPENEPTAREQNIQLINKKVNEKKISDILNKKIIKNKDKMNLNKIIEGNLKKKLKDKDYNYFLNMIKFMSQSDINDLKNVLIQQVKTLKNYYSKEDITQEQKNNMLDEIKFINRYNRELRENTSKGEKTADYEYFYNIVKDYTKTELKDMKKNLIKKAQNKYTTETERLNILDELKYLNRILSEKK